MVVFKSGDLVVLRSGGPVMTVDTVNTDIFDDNKMTGVLCVWFVGDKLERVRFDHRTITTASQSEPCAKEPAMEPLAMPEMEASGDYKVVLDSMVGAMNMAGDIEEFPKAAPKRQKGAVRIPEKTH